jgi:hypothetical protein
VSTDDDQSIGFDPCLFLVSPRLVAQMLEIQPYRLIGQSLRRALQYLIDQSKPFYYQHSHSLEKPTVVTVAMGPTSNAKRLLLKRQLSLIDYFVLEILHHYVADSISKAHSAITAAKPALVESIWQHILTRFVLGECSPLVLITAQTNTHASMMNQDQQWCDEQACRTLQRLLEISSQCADHGVDSTDFAHANEYLVLALQQMATTGSLLAN